MRAIRTNLRRPGGQPRRGAVTVEFAVVAPLLVGILLGMVQASRIFETQNLLATAAREGGRLAGMDREGLVASGDSTNTKVKQDIQNLLKASGVPTGALRVDIVDPDNSSIDFDLDAPANAYKLFAIEITLPYTDQFTGISGFDLTSKVVFRNGRAAIME